MTFIKETHFWGTNPSLAEYQWCYYTCFVSRCRNSSRWRIHRVMTRYPWMSTCLWWRRHRLLNTGRFLLCTPWAWQWRHNDNDSVSNHQPHGCLLNRLFGRWSKKTSKLRVTGLCAGNSPGTGEFPAQMASNAENISIWWRHHVNNTPPGLPHISIY